MYQINRILLPKSTVRKNCSSDRDKLLKFEAESQEFAKILSSLEQFIQTVKFQNNFFAFLTCFWMFLISNELEQLELKLEKGFVDLDQILYLKPLNMNYFGHFLFHFFWYIISFFLYLLRTIGLSVVFCVN
jgi:hypothetical protein